MISKKRMFNILFVDLPSYFTDPLKLFFFIFYISIPFLHPSGTGFIVSMPSITLFEIRIVHLIPKIDQLTKHAKPKQCVYQDYLVRDS